MTEPAPPPRLWERVLRDLCVALAGLSVLYILGTGPICWLLLDRSPAADRVLDRLYYPLAWACREPAIDRLFRPYIDWWSHLPGGPYERTHPHEP